QCHCPALPCGLAAALAQETGSAGPGTGSAAHVFEPLQLQVLEQQTGKKRLTVKGALGAIAARAGFTPSKKQPLPGEKIIGRGWNICSSRCRGYQLALQKTYGT